MNNRKPYSVEEKFQIVKLFAEGKSSKHIARQIKRANGHAVSCVIYGKGKTPSHVRELADTGFSALDIFHDIFPEHKDFQSSETPIKTQVVIKQNKTIKEVSGLSALIKERDTLMERVSALSYAITVLGGK